MNTFLNSFRGPQSSPLPIAATSQERLRESTENHELEGIGDVPASDLAPAGPAPTNEITPRYQGTARTVILADEDSISSVRMPKVVDFVTFLAIIQSLRVTIFDFEPDISNLDDKKELGNRVKSISVDAKRGLIFKSELNARSENVGNRTLIMELLVLQHPVLRAHPNIQDVLGVAWSPDLHMKTRRPTDASKAAAVDFKWMFPMLVFKQSQYGSLWKFVEKTRKGKRKPLPLVAKLRLCLDISSAIEVMHRFNIVHADIKPQNVLIFEENNRYVAKVIDFGCSCFGQNDQVSVKLNFVSIPWQAPERHNADGVLQTTYKILEAKKLDAFSFGKICAWLLFSLEVSGETEHDAFNLDDAIKTLVSANPDPELEPGAPRNGDYVKDITPLLKKFFVSSYNPKSGARRPFGELSQKLTAMLRVWEQKYEHSRPRMIAIPPISLKQVLKSVTEALRALFAKVISAFIFERTKAEFFIPGELRMTTIPDSIRNISFITVLVSVATIAMGVVLSEIPEWTGQSSSIIARILITGLILSMLLLVFLIRGLCRDRDEYHMLSSLFLPFGHIAHVVPHLPKLFPVLNRQHYYVRDKVVEGLRKRVLDPSEHNCHECCRRAARQLALCSKTAFGAPNLIESADWLKISGRKNVDDLCQEVDFWEDRYWPREVEDMGSSSYLFTVDLADHKTYRKMNAATISRHKQDLDKKMKSNVCLSSTLVLQIQLAELYSERYMYQDEQRTWEKMAETERKILSTRRWSSGFRLRQTFNTYTTDMKVALALENQGKLHEAIDLLKEGLLREPATVTWWQWLSLALRRKLIAKKRAALWSARLKRETLVMRFLTREERYDEAVQSALIGMLQVACRNDDAISLKKNIYRRSNIKLALAAIDDLAISIIAKKGGLVSDAILLLDHCLSFREKFMPVDEDLGTDDNSDGSDSSDDSDDSDEENDSDREDEEDEGDEEDDENVADSDGGVMNPVDGTQNHLDHPGAPEGRPGRREFPSKGHKSAKRIWKAEYQLSCALSLGSLPEVQRALSYQRWLLEDGPYGYGENAEETLSLQSVHSLALFRAGQHDQAIRVMKGVIWRKKKTYGDAHLVSLGCMADLAGSLCLHGKSALEMPAKMQGDFLIWAKDFSGEPTTHNFITTLLWVFTRADLLDLALLKMNELLCDLKSRHPRQRVVILTLEFHLAFILTHFGSTFNDPTHFDTPFSLVQGVMHELKTSPGKMVGTANDITLADSSALKAAIYSKKTKMLCDAHGFGQSDVDSTFLDSIMAHRESLQEAISAYGLTDPRSLDTRVRLAINLSDIGIALDDKEKISKALREFEFAIKEYESRDQSAQALYEKFVLRGCGDGKFIKLNKLRTRFNDLRKSMMADKVGPGKLALHWHMVEVLHKSGRCKSINTDHKVPKATLKALKDYKSLRKWSYTPDLHPDVLRAIWSYARHLGERDKYYNMTKEQTYLSKLYWFSSQVYKNDNDQAAVVKMSYIVRLAVALSRDAEYAQQSINICREVLEKTRSLPCVGTAAHTLTASFLFDYSEVLWKSNRREESIEQNTASLRLYLDLLPPTHPRVVNIAETLIERILEDGESERAQKEMRKLMKAEIGKTANKYDIAEICFYFAADVQVLGGMPGFAECQKNELMEMLKDTDIVVDTLLEMTSQVELKIRDLTTGA